MRVQDVGDDDMYSYCYSVIRAGRIRRANKKQRVHYQTWLTVIAAAIVIFANCWSKSLHRRLHNALLGGDLASAQTYIRYHLAADPRDLAMALGTAARNQDQTSIMWLLSYCPRIQITDALFDATSELSPTVVKLLLQHGADATAHDKVGNSLLSHAMSPDDSSYALSRSASVKEPLSRRREVIHLLRQSGACLTFFESIRFADTETVKLGLQRGVDLHSSSRLGISPLRFAYLQLELHASGPELARRLQVIALLRAAGAHCSFEEATQYSFCDELKWHLKHGADPNERSLIGSPLIYTCSAEGSTEVVRILLDHGADPNASTKNGRTPLMTARSTHNDKMERLLIARGARD